jgi:hypothetical protein
MATLPLSKWEKKPTKTPKSAKKFAAIIKIVQNFPTPAGYSAKCQSVG